MKDKTTGIALAFVLIIFILVFAITDGFKGATMVASSNVHVSTAAPTVNDDIDRGFLAGAIWIDQTGTDAYIAISTADGAADWDQID